MLTVMHPDLNLSVLMHVSETPGKISLLWIECRLQNSNLISTILVKIRDHKSRKVFYHIILYLSNISGNLSSIF